MSGLIKELTIQVYVNEMQLKNATPTPQHIISDKRYYKFKCKFYRIRDDKEGYEIFYKVKYRKGFTLFNDWSDCGVFSIYSEGRIQILIDQCEQFLTQQGLEVIPRKSCWS